MKKYLLTGLKAGLIILLFSACERTTERDTTENKDEIIVTGESKAEEELKEFRNWVRSKGSQVDTSSHENWTQVKEEYKRRTQELDRDLNQLSEKSKAEYQELKQDYENWETNRAARLTLPLDTDTLNQMQQQLLGKYAAVNAVPAHELKDAYLYFMQQVRSKRSSWSPNDWDYVNRIYRNLNARRDEVDDAIATSDKLKITALQTEYLSFEAANDARELGREIRN